MIHYIENALAPALGGKRTLLLLDHHTAHLTENVQEALRVHNITPLMIPSKF